MTGDRATPLFTLTPGPAGATPATLAVLSQPILHHQDPAFFTLYVQITHIGPAACPLGPVIALVALGRALRRVGAAAVEAALGEDPLFERGLSRKLRDRMSARDGIRRLTLTQHPNGYEKRGTLVLAPSRTRRYAVGESFVWSLCAGCDQRKVLA